MNVEIPAITVRTSKKHAAFIRGRLDAANPYIIMQGGRRSGKTWSIIQFLFIESCKGKKRVLLVTDTFARLNNTLFTDIENITQGLGRLTKGSNPCFVTVNGSRWDFVCANRNTKGYASVYDYIFFNEAIQYGWEVVRDILKACGEKCRIFIDYNPYMRFWANDKCEEADHSNKLVTTYHDNRFIPETARLLLEEQEKAGADAPHGTLERYLYEVECLGVDSARSGLCFPNADIITIEQYESVQAPELLGMDWGVVKEVGDPDAIIAIKVVDDDIYIRELYYSNSGTDEDIAHAINSWKGRCKDERPLALYEYASFGEQRMRSVVAAGASREIAYSKCTKHKVETDLINMCRAKLHMTSESKNVINEQQNYKYVEKDGRLVAGDDFNHAMDALRYAWNGYNEWRFKTYGTI